ncbi:hypothetical protein LOTGIDRAFT_160058 [Lottia gigantea]|uniref:Uncharacterized protein n=1 Tax=Lottia gigantea TaxID=225164 RepID=V3ZX20_LOTGI|nr:hypothetical protein LOTGIDRAFT_160058 [Lottia gigantea]ESO96073.1 hypothetical protein LOTGIDRAFT_160058 [Lottia gigantea]
MSSNEKSTETHECQDESSDRPIRTKTKSVKALEAAIMEKTKLFWKSQKDLEQNTNAVFRCDPFSPHIPELKEKLKVSLEHFEKELTELKQLFTQHDVDSMQRQSLLATADKWLKLANGATSSTDLPPPILQPLPRDQISHASTTSSVARRLEARARLAEEKTKQEYEERIQVEMLNCQQYGLGV